MNGFGNFSKPITWLVALLLAAFVAGCGGGGGGGGTAAPATPANVIPGAAGSPGAAATNPTVNSSNPGSGDTNVSTSTNSPGNIVTGKLLTATFSEAMNPATINSAPAGTLLTFTLRETVAGTNVPGTVAMNAANTIATFTPTAAALTANTSYTATVTTAARNAGGTAMPSPVVWSFTTSATVSNSQGPLNLGNAGTFAIFSNTAVTSVFPSDVKGNIGTAGTGSNTTITCPEVTPIGVSKVFTVDATFADATCNTIDAVFVSNTALDLSNAITDAKGRVVPDSVDDQTGVAGNISGLTLAPGLYKWNTGVLIDNTGITITGGANDVWIFQISGDLTVQNNAIITLGGSAQAKNIFWQVGGVTGAIIGSAVDFKGIILADAGITLTAGSTVLGRLFANPAITLITNTITPPAP